MSVSEFEHRGDCKTRFEMIKSTMPDFRGKSIIDIGCAKGWFPIMFLEEGMSRGVGIETSERLRNDANQEAIDRNINFKCYESINEIGDEQFDYCLHLDLHFSCDSYLPWIKNHCKVLYISPSREGIHTNEPLEKELSETFGNYELIGCTGYVGRNLYKVIIDGIN